VGPRYPEGYGYSLGVVYVVWLLVVALAYPLCRWFAGVKQRRREWWIAYL
jgi:ABC-type spermidine/putrescine transport system permease subunit I